MGTRRIRKSFRWWCIESKRLKTWQSASERNSSGGGPAVGFSHQLVDEASMRAVLSLHFLKLWSVGMTIHHWETSCICVHRPRSTKLQLNHITSDVRRYAYVERNVLMSDGMTVHVRCAWMTCELWHYHGALLPVVIWLLYNKHRRRITYIRVQFVFVKSWMRSRVSIITLALVQMTEVRTFRSFTLVRVLLPSHLTTHPWFDKNQRMKYL